MRNARAFCTQMGDSSKKIVVVESEAIQISTQVETALCESALRGE